MAAQDSLQVVREWLLAALDRSKEQIEVPEIWTGNGRVTGGLGKWLDRGILALRSVVASEIVELFQGLETWLPEGLTISPCNLPDKREIDKMLWYVRDLDRPRPGR